MGQIRHGKIVSPARIEQGHPKAQRLVYAEGRYGATLRGFRMAPQKVRLVLDQIRGLPVERAREVLRYSSKRAAYLADRVLMSALGNADVKSNGRVGAAELVVAEAYCNEGSRLHRFKAGPMGRARPIIRRSSHLTVVLGERPEGTAEAAPAKGQKSKKSKKSKSKKGAGKSEGAKQAASE